MDRRYLKLIITGISSVLFLLCTSFSYSAEEEKTEEKEQVDKADMSNTTDKSDKSDNVPEKDTLMERIDFGNSYILGQSIKSGAVYLLHRKQSDIKSMLKIRDDYRKEILEDLKVVDKK